MAAPTASDLETFVGNPLNAAQATAVIQVVTAMASAYTRGQGFTDGEPNSDIWAVILSAAARLIADTSQITNEETMGPFRVTYNDHTAQWSTSERYVLNRYRARAW